MSLPPQPLYGLREYPLQTACQRIRETADQMANRIFRVLLWTNPKGFSIEKGRFGQQEIEHGYHAREEDFINELTATGNRWKWERATKVEELQDCLAKAEFGALVILGSSPSYLIRKAVYYCEHVPIGPKNVFLEFEPRFWDSTHPYAIWDYLHRNGHIHLLGGFVHLVTRKRQLKFLPLAYEHELDLAIPIWEIPAHRLTSRNIEVLFDKQIEEGLRLDYKRAAAVSDSKELDQFIYRLCAMANTRGGTIIVGVRERDGVPIHPSSQGLEDIVNPDKVLNRIAQIMSSRFGKNAPEIEPRTLTIHGKTVIILQVGESVTKQCGIKWEGKQGKIPVRVDRTTDWIPLEQKSATPALA
jgi:hypothetical protein